MTPTLTGNVVGFRRWYLDGTTLTAISQTYGPVGPGPHRSWIRYRWVPGPNRAECRTRSLREQHRFDAPARNCHCGLHAFHDTVDPKRIGGEVFGIVAGWGKTQVHCNCWRAEYAQVVALLPHPYEPWRIPISEVAERYEVPIVGWNGAEAFASEYGQPIPREMRPPVPRGYSQERG